MMQRYRLRVKGLIISVLAFIACLAIFLVLVFYTGRARADVTLDLKYYFLVRDCDDSTSAAVVGEVYSAGGAGYLDGESVILACYDAKADARRVCSLMEQKGETVHVTERELKSLTLRGDRARYGEKVKENAETAKSVARLLYDTANGLETGTLSQSLAKANVKGAADALNGLIARNGDKIFEAWNRTLYAVAADLRDVTGGLLFAKDVRYVQISLCCGLLAMDRCF